LWEHQVESIDVAYREDSLPQTFYITPNGSYLGKEFMFVASQDPASESYYIFAVENADVTITREDDAKNTFRLGPNTHKQLSLKALSVYGVESMGNIMIQSGWPGGSSFFIPSPPEVS